MLEGKIERGLVLLGEWQRNKIDCILWCKAHMLYQRREPDSIAKEEPRRKDK